MEPTLGLDRVFPPRPLSTSPRYGGIYRAKVQDVDDRGTDHEFLCRVRVWVPQIHGEDYEDKTEDLPWAWPVSLQAGVQDDGTRSGAVAMPIEGMWVYVLFENGDPDKPVWFGGWFGEDSAGESEINENFLQDSRSSARYPEIIGWISPWEGKIKVRVLKKERVEVLYGDPSSPDAIVEFDSVGYNPNTEPTVRVQTKWQAKIKASKNVEIESDETVKIKCKKLEIETEEDITVLAGTTSSYTAAQANVFAGASIIGRGRPNGGFDLWGITRRRPSGSEGV